MKKYGTPDRENPEWTADEVANAQHAGDVFPDAFATTVRARRHRGPQTKPTKQLVSLRLDRATLETYRATGSGWQSRMNDDLAKAAKQIARRKS